MQFDIRQCIFTALLVCAVGAGANTAALAQETTAPPPPESAAPDNRPETPGETAEAPRDIDMTGSIMTGFWPVERNLPRPEMGNRDTIRFITESDYPPFHYLDSAGVLVGFNVDLAWGICTALKVRCTIRRVDWNRMAEELSEGRADAAIASPAYAS